MKMSLNARGHMFQWPINSRFIFPRLALQRQNQNVDQLFNALATEQARVKATVAIVKNKLHVLPCYICIYIYINIYIYIYNIHIYII